MLAVALHSNSEVRWLLEVVSLIRHGAPAFRGLGFGA